MVRRRGLQRTTRSAQGHGTAGDHRPVGASARENRRMSSEFPAHPWLVLRTKSRHESVVESALQQREVVSYLPKRKVVSHWQGRKRTVETPLFPGYLFVRPRVEQYEGMRYIRGSCGFVLAGDRKPATLPEKDVK